MANRAHRPRNQRITHRPRTEPRRHRQTDIDTSVPFYNHMMTALGKHSLIDLTIHAHGDTDIDVHHTVEDTAIVFGEALKQALGDKKGIRRFADATVPLDEARPGRGRHFGRLYCVCSGEPEGYEFCMIGGHFTGARWSATSWNPSPSTPASVCT